MDAKTIAELLRAGLGVLAAVREWRANASPDQLKAFVAAIHAQGKTVDAAAVDQVLADLDAGQAALEKQIADAGG